MTFEWLLRVLLGTKRRQWHGKSWATHTESQVPTPQPQGCNKTALLDRPLGFVPRTSASDSRVPFPLLPLFSLPSFLPSLLLSLALLLSPNLMRKLFFSLLPLPNFISHDAAKSQGPFSDPWWPKEEMPTGLKGLARQMGRCDASQLVSLSKSFDFCAIIFSGCCLFAALFPSLILVRRILDPAVLERVLLLCFCSQFAFTSCSLFCLLTFRPDVKFQRQILGTEIFDTYVRIYSTVH